MDIWKTDEDVDYDMFTLSEFTEGNIDKPPSTKRENHMANNPNKENTASIYDFEDVNGLDEGEKQKIAQRQLISTIGRGYVMHKYRGVNKSQNVMPQRVLDQTERDIREVCPMGYSNEFIEAAYKKLSEPNGATRRLAEGCRFSPTSDVVNGAIPKKSGGSSRSTTSSATSSVANDLPPDFVEYDMTSNLKLSDKVEFPSL